MTYLDNAATSYPKPAIVQKAVWDAMTIYGGNPGRSGHAMAMRVSEKIFAVRSSAAAFFGTELENVIFTQNCTMALNMAIKGVMRQGGHVILSCLEHNSVIRPIYKLHKEGICNYSIASVFEDNDEATVAAFENEIRPDTRAIVCTHASNVSGAVLPIEALGQLCRKKGLLFIVDAAQSAGVLPINMKTMNIDFLCMPGHKGLYGITGSGILLINSETKLDTLLEGGTGSLSADREQPDFYPDRLEAGTVNTPGILSIGAGLDFIRNMGRENIYQREFRHCKRLYDILSGVQGVHLVNRNYTFGRNAPIVSFAFDGMESEELTRILNRYGFALRGGLHCAPLAHEHYNTADGGLVRFAPSVFTSDAQVQDFSRKVQIIRKKPLGSLEL